MCLLFCFFCSAIFAVFGSVCVFVMSGTCNNVEFDRVAYHQNMRLSQNQTQCGTNSRERRGELFGPLSHQRVLKKRRYNSLLYRRLMIKTDQINSLSNFASCVMLNYYASLAFSFRFLVLFCSLRILTLAFAFIISIINKTNEQENHR